MAHDWIIDVLSDLKAYADNNDLGALAEHLDEARLIAAAEISTVEAREAGSIGATRERARTVQRGIAAGRDA